jgi:hypothetical protein
LGAENPNRERYSVCKTKSKSKPKKGKGKKKEIIISDKSQPLREVFPFKD